MANNSLLQKNSNLNHIYQNRESYLNLLPSVLQFLQGKHPELAHRIASRQLLPEAERFRAIADMDWAFGTLGVQEKASHIATLFLEDVCTFIRETASPHFEPIRYAEKLATYAPTFDKLQEEIDSPADPVMEAMEQLLRNQMITQQPKIVGFTVPFPGNLVAALRGCRLIKKEFSNTITVLGGGFPTTELRSLTDTRIFAYANYVVLDDGLSAIRAIAQRHISHKETAKPTSTWYLENNKLQFSPENKDDAVKFAELPCPDFTDLPHHLYLGLLDMIGNRSRNSRTNIVLIGNAVTIGIGTTIKLSKSWNKWTIILFIWNPILVGILRFTPKGEYHTGMDVSIGCRLVVWKSKNIIGSSI